MAVIVKKGDNFFRKNGKRNIILLSIILISFVVVRLYNTFSLNTEIIESYVDGVKTYRFILSNNNEENSVVIGANSSKNISIKITNPDNVKLKYGLYYSSMDVLTDFYITFKYP